MQVTETLAEGLKRELKVVIPASELASRLDAYLEDLKGKVNIKGFRPGKVPAGHLKRLYGRQATAEILNEMLTESTPFVKAASQTEYAAQGPGPRSSQRALTDRCSRNNVE
mgnify:CR=1 FL=1